MATTKQILFQAIEEYGSGTIAGERIDWMVEEMVYGDYQVDNFDDQIFDVL